MIFGQKNIPITVQKFLIDGVELPQVSDTKFLGVIVDGKFTWEKHIDAHYPAKFLSKLVSLKK